MVRRVPASGSGEFKLGAQVIVRERQTAAFFGDGQSLDTFGLRMKYEMTPGQEHHLISTECEWHQINFGPLWIAAGR